MTATPPESRAPKGTLIGILALFFLAPLAGLITPNIANIVEVFGISAGEASWVATISSLVMIPVAIGTGVIAGRRLSFRALAITGIVIFSLAGMMPLVTGEDFALLLLSRALWGVGAGLIFTLANSLVVVTYQDEQVRARMFGLGNVVFCIGSVLGLLAGGYLATLSWTAPFAGHLIGVVGLVLVAAFLREPEIAADAAETAAPRARIAPIAYLPLICFALVIVAIYPMMTLMSVVFTQADLGSAELVGVVSSLLTVVGFFVSLAFGKIYGLLGRAVLPLSFLVIAVGLAVLFFSSATGAGSIVGYSIGVGIAGAGLMGATIGTPMVISTLVPASAGAAAQGLFSAALNLGGVISSAYATLAIGLLGGPDGLVQPIYLISAVAAVVLALPLLALRRRKAAEAPPQPVA